MDATHPMNGHAKEPSMIDNSYNLFNVTLRFANSETLSPALQSTENRRDYGCVTTRPGAELLRGLQPQVAIDN